MRCIHFLVAHVCHAMPTDRPLRQTPHFVPAAAMLPLHCLDPPATQLSDAIITLSASSCPLALNLKRCPLLS